MFAPYFLYSTASSPPGAQIKQYVKRPQYACKEQMLGDTPDDNDNNGTPDHLDAATCKTKDANCKQCTGGDTCTKCEHRWFLRQGTCHSCSSVDANCDTCSSADTCTTCNAGYTLDGNGACRRPTCADGPCSASSCDADTTTGVLLHFTLVQDLRERPCSSVDCCVANSARLSNRVYLASDKGDGIDISPDGKHVYIVSFEDKTLFKFDRDASTGR